MFSGGGGFGSLDLENYAINGKEEREEVILVLLRYMFKENML